MGGDLFGVASPEILAAAPEGFRPQDILPGCRSVVVVGKRLSDATVDTTPSRMFDNMYSATNSFLEFLILKITDTLAAEGFRAVAVGPHSLDGKRLMGDISQKHAAVGGRPGQVRAAVPRPKPGFRPEAALGNGDHPRAAPAGRSFEKGTVPAGKMRPGLREELPGKCFLSAPRAKG